MKKLTKTLVAVCITLALAVSCEVSEEPENINLTPVKMEGCQGNENCGDGGSTPPPGGGG